MSETLDLHTIFDAVEHQTEGSRFTLERLVVGKLETRGSIVACDPFGGVNEPFAQRVQQGSFEVELLLARHSDHVEVALARVVFLRARPARFELALRPGQDPRALAPGQRFGYIVDSGTGCFATPEALGKFDSDALLKELHATSESLYATAVPAGEGHELIAFNSGGDGIYTSWFGIGETGAPSSLVTDFHVLELKLPELPDDPSFRREVAERAASRLFAALPGLDATQEEAFHAARELWASPEDAAHLVEAIFARYLSTTGSAASLLAKVVTKLLAAPEVQRLLAPHLASADEARWVQLLKGVRDTIAEPLLEALWQRWDGGSSALKQAILHLVTQARPSIDQASRFQQAAIEALRSGDASIEEESLGVLDILLTLGMLAPLDESELAAVRHLSTAAPRERTRRDALKLLARSQPKR